MATAKQFEDLRVWQDARELVREVYKATKQRGFRRDFSLRDQITRAAVSTMSNIAEGFERETRKEFMQFLSVAKGSNGEVRSQLYVALDQDYLTKSNSMNCVSPRLLFHDGSPSSSLTWMVIRIIPAFDETVDAKKENLQLATFNLQLT